MNIFYHSGVKLIILKKFVHDRANAISQIITDVSYLAEAFQIIVTLFFGKFNGTISKFLMVEITGLTKSAQNEILYF